MSRTVSQELYGRMIEANIYMDSIQQITGTTSPADALAAVKELQRLAKNAIGGCE